MNSGCDKTGGDVVVSKMVRVANGGAPDASWIAMGGVAVVEMRWRTGTRRGDRGRVAGGDG